MKRIVLADDTLVNIISALGTVINIDETEKYYNLPSWIHKKEDGKMFLLDFDELPNNIKEMVENQSSLSKFSLDVDSIIELGWQKQLADRGMSENYGASFIKTDKSFSQANYDLSFWKQTSRVRINRISGVIFDGIIKTNYELREVMKYLQIY